MCFITVDHDVYELTDRQYEKLLVLIETEENIDLNSIGRYLGTGTTLEELKQIVLNKI